MDELPDVLRVKVPGSCGLSCTPKVATSDEHNFPWFQLVVTLKAHPSRDRQGASNALFRFALSVDGRKFRGDRILGAKTFLDFACCSFLASKSRVFGKKRGNTKKHLILVKKTNFQIGIFP